MAKDKVSVESLVNEALRKLATADGPMKLSGKGDSPALFASAAGANKAAIAQLQDTANPLIRSEGKNGPVKLTAAGFSLVLPSIPEEKVGSLAKGFAADIPTAAARVEFLQQIVSRTPLATAELLPVLEAATAAELAETEARLEAAKKRREAEDASRKAIERWVAVLGERQAARVAALRWELEIEGEKAEGPRPAAPQLTASPAAMPQAATPEEKDFRRNVARRLVSAWRETIDLNKPEARRFMEVAIGNIDGIEQIEDEGERVAFDGTLHRCDVGVSTGAEVTVVRPGWKLAEDGGQNVIEKALVKP